MQEEFIRTKQELWAVKLYEGGEIKEEELKEDEFYHQKSAYETLNLLMMIGSEGEKVRVCEEDRKPNSIFIRNWKRTVEAMTDIFAVSCRYAIHCANQGKPLPSPLNRGDRRVNFQMMQEEHGTFAFTSVTKGMIKKWFAKSKKDPHELHITLCEGVPYLDFEEFLGEDYKFRDQKEVLLPPLLQMEHGACRRQNHEGIGPVSHYDVKITGFCTNIETTDERELLKALDAHAARAAEGLDDLLLNKSEADIFHDANHPYWKWKKAFRELVVQRMQGIYKKYYGV